MANPLSLVGAAGIAKGKIVWYKRYGAANRTTSYSSTLNATTQDVSYTERTEYIRQDNLSVLKFTSSKKGRYTFAVDGILSANEGYIRLRVNGSATWAEAAGNNTRRQNLLYSVDLSEGDVVEIQTRQTSTNPVTAVHLVIWRD